MDFLVDVALPISLAIIMLSLGVGLTVRDFLRVGEYPTAFLVGACHQVILLPIVAFGVATVFGLSGAIAVGFMILAFCPGGVTSNMLAKLANGDVALSVSLTAVISLVSVLTVPVLLAVTVDFFMGAAAPEVDIFGIALAMFLITIVPIGLGILFRQFAPASANKVEPILDIVAKILFVVIVLAAIAANWDVFIQYIGSLGPAMVVLCALLLAIGFYVPVMFNRSKQEARTISVETGIQNATLAIAIAAFFAAGESGLSEYAIPGATYGIVMYLVAIPAIYVMRRL